MARYRTYLPGPRVRLTYPRLAPEAGRNGNRDDPASAISVLLVAVAVLTYHLLARRADLAVTHVAHGTASAAADSGSHAALGAVATLELTGPSGTDFETIVAALRERLPAVSRCGWSHRSRRRPLTGREIRRTGRQRLSGVA